LRSPPFLREKIDLRPVFPGGTDAGRQCWRGPKVSLKEFEFPSDFPSKDARFLRSRIGGGAECRRLVRFHARPVAPDVKIGGSKQRNAAASQGGDSSKGARAGEVVSRPTGQHGRDSIDPIPQDRALLRTVHVDLAVHLLRRRYPDLGGAASSVGSMGRTARCRCRGKFRCDLDEIGGNPATSHRPAPSRDSEQRRHPHARKTASPSIWRPRDDRIDIGFGW